MVYITTVCLYQAKSDRGASKHDITKTVTALQTRGFQNILYKT